MWKENSVTAKPTEDKKKLNNEYSKNYLNLEKESRKFGGINQQGFYLPSIDKKENSIIIPHLHPQSHLKSRESTKKKEEKKNKSIISNKEYSLTTKENHISDNKDSHKSLKEKKNLRLNQPNSKNNSNIINNNNYPLHRIRNKHNTIIDNNKNWEKLGTTTKTTSKKNIIYQNETKMLSINTTNNQKNSSQEVHNNYDSSSLNNNNIEKKNDNIKLLKSQNEKKKLFQEIQTLSANSRRKIGNVKTSNNSNGSKTNFVLDSDLFGSIENNGSGIKNLKKLGSYGQGKQQERLKIKEIKDIEKKKHEPFLHDQEKKIKLFKISSHGNLLEGSLNNKILEEVRKKENKSFKATKIGFSKSESKKKLNHISANSNITTISNYSNNPLKNYDLTSEDDNKKLSRLKNNYVSSANGRSRSNSLSKLNLKERSRSNSKLELDTNTIHNTHNGFTNSTSDKPNINIHKLLNSSLNKEFSNIGIIDDITKKQIHNKEKDQLFEKQLLGNNLNNNYSIEKENKVEKNQPNLKKQINHNMDDIEVQDLENETIVIKKAGTSQIINNLMVDEVNTLQVKQDSQNEKIGNENDENFTLINNNGQLTLLNSKNEVIESKKKENSEELSELSNTNQNEKGIKNKTKKSKKNSKKNNNSTLTTTKSNLKENSKPTLSTKTSKISASSLSHSTTTTSQTNTKNTRNWNNDVKIKYDEESSNRSISMSSLINHRPIIHTNTIDSLIQAKRSPYFNNSCTSLFFRKPLKKKKRLNESTSMGSLERKGQRKRRYKGIPRRNTRNKKININATKLRRKLGDILFSLDDNSSNLNPKYKKCLKSLYEFRSLEEFYYESLKKLKKDLNNKDVNISNRALEQYKKITEELAKKNKPKKNSNGNRTGAKVNRRTNRNRHMYKFYRENGKLIIKSTGGLMSSYKLKRRSALKRKPTSLQSLARALSKTDINERKTIKKKKKKDSNAKETEYDIHKYYYNKCKNRDNYIDMKMCSDIASDEYIVEYNSSAEENVEQNELINIEKVNEEPQDHQIDNKDYENIYLNNLGENNIDDVDDISKILFYDYENNQIIRKKESGSSSKSSLNSKKSKKKSHSQKSLNNKTKKHVLSTVDTNMTSHYTRKSFTPNYLKVKSKIKTKDRQLNSSKKKNSNMSLFSSNTSKKSNSKKLSFEDKKEKSSNLLKNDISSNTLLLNMSKAFDNKVIGTNTHALFQNFLNTENSLKSIDFNINTEENTNKKHKKNSKKADEANKEKQVKKKKKALKYIKNKLFKLIFLK